MVRFHTSSSSKHEVRMLRQPSYRNIPTASDFEEEYKDEVGEENGEELPSLETSLDLDSYFEDEGASSDLVGAGEEVDRGVYQYRMESRSNRGDNAERGQVKSITKGTYDFEGPLHDHDASQTEGVGVQSLDHRNDYDDDISYNSVEYEGSQASYDQDDNDGDNEGNPFTSGNSNISTVIDDFLKDDYFSDSSEEETFFIEEKDRDDNGYTRRSIIGHFKSYSEPVLMLARNLSLHTIDEEGSIFNDEGSITSFEPGRRNDTNKNTISQPTKIISMKRHRSAPASSDVQHNKNNYNKNPLQKMNDLEQEQHGDRGLSLELLRCFSVDTNNLSSCASSSNIHSSAGDIESHEIHERGGLPSSSKRRRIQWTSYKERLKTSRSFKIRLLATVLLLLLSTFIIFLIVKLATRR